MFSVKLCDNPSSNISKFPRISNKETQCPAAECGPFRSGEIVWDAAVKLIEIKPCKDCVRPRDFNIQQSKQKSEISSNLTSGSCLCLWLITYYFFFLKCSAAILPCKLHNGNEFGGDIVYVVYTTMMYM